MISFFISIWDTFVYKPAYNLVIYSYHLSPGPNLGVAIIGIAILIRFIFLYFTLRGYQQDAVLEKVQPEIDRIEADQKLSSKEKYQKISSITSPLGINPFYESIPIFAQAIFLVALYQIFQVGIAHPDYKDLYGFVAPPTSINTNFFGFNLAQPALLLSLLGSGVLLIERVWEYNEKNISPPPKACPKNGIR